MMAGGSAMLAYSFITEYLSLHEEANPRPRIIDHLIATSIIGFGAGAITFNSLRGGIQGFLFVGLNLGLLSWWFKSFSFRPGGASGHANIHYEKDVTPEEKERIEMMDQTEILAYNMSMQPGYGLVQLAQKHQ